MLDRQKRIDEDGIAFAVHESDRIGNPSEIFFAGGRPWVELPRFLVSSFQFRVDIYLLRPRRMIAGNVPRFDGFDRVYKRLF
jgi:hypothetical protein